MLNSADYFGFGFFGWFKANTKSLRTADLMPQISEFQSKVATNDQNFEKFFQAPIFFARTARHLAGEERVEGPSQRPRRRTRGLPAKVEPGAIVAIVSQTLKSLVGCKF